MNKPFDPFPRYPAAGLKVDNPNESTQVCLNPPEQPIKTPQQIVHYRRSFKERPGVTIAHYGTAKDPLPPTNHVYGQVTEKSETVGNLLQAQKSQGMNGFLNALQEAKYSSSKKEPLGRGLTRNYKWPEQCTQSGFKYGKGTEGNQYSAKQTLSPNENLIQSDEIKKMYLKSHGSFEPGQQKDRQFKWNVNPAEYRFGRVEKNPVNNEIYQIMQPEAQTDTFVQTRFVKTNYNDFVNFKDDKLGKPRNLAQNNNLPLDFTYGVKLSTNEWDAGKCLTGEASFKDVEDDQGLGKSSKLGCTNVPRPGDESRVFGIPTIRTDIPKPKNSSIANSMNYGEQTRAIELLFPPTYSQLGISQQDFLEKRDRQTVKEIFYNIGYNLDSLQFQEVFSRAKRVENSQDDRISVRGFLDSIYALGMQRPHHRH